MYKPLMTIHIDVPQPLENQQDKEFHMLIKKIKDWN